MRWTGGVGLAVGALALSGCVYGYRTVSFGGRYSMDSRPDGSYYCYDCHGYRFFDPYYDYCSYYGFRYGWDEHPGAATVYRQRYVRIRQAHPEYGRGGSGDDGAERRAGWKERQGAHEGKKERTHEKERERDGRRPSPSSRGA